MPFLSPIVRACCRNQFLLREIEKGLSFEAALAPGRYAEKELANRRYLLTLEKVAYVARCFAGWADSCGRATVQSIHQILGQLRIPLRCALLRV
jgi:hypothetical protein